MTPLAQALEKSGISISDLARHLGTSRQNVSRWAAGKVKFPVDHAPDTAAFLGVTREFLVLGSTQAQSQSQGYRVEPNAVFEGPAILPAKAGPRDIEERGVTVGGFGDDDSAFELNGQVIDMVIRPPGIANRQGVFALRVANESMVPKFEDGERVYVEPRKAAIGEYVVVELYPDSEDGAGKSYIKRLVSQNSGGVRVQQFNPKGYLEFRRDEIKQILRVIPTLELLGM